MIALRILTRGLLLILLTLAIAIPAAVANADELFIAVAADFADTAGELGKEFTERTGAEVQITSASSGELAKKIEGGERFDVFMSAGSKFTEQLSDKGLVSGEPVVYALGVLALYAKDKDMSKEGLTLLQSEDFSKFVIADPKMVPYGKAAVEFLKSEDVYKMMKDKIVYAPNVIEALNQIESGQADAGLVSYPDLDGDQKKTAWITPRRFYKPLEQTAVMISNSPNSDMAEKWMKYLQSNTAQEMILEAGFGLEGETITDTPEPPKE